MRSKLSPAVKALIDESAKKIFKHMPVVAHRTGYSVIMTNNVNVTVVLLQILRPKLIGPLITNHYLPNIRKALKDIMPGCDTDYHTRRAIRLQKLKRRGKGPPKKGQGKRAMKLKAKK